MHFLPRSTRLKGLKTTVRCNHDSVLFCLSFQGQHFLCVLECLWRADRVQLPFKLSLKEISIDALNLNSKSECVLLQLLLFHFAKVQHSSLSSYRTKELFSFVFLPSGAKLWLITFPTRVYIMKLDSVFSLKAEII